MTPALDALEAARRAAEGLVDPAPLDGALEALRAPPVVLVVGRRGAGKSSLVAFRTGVPQPVGLCGVTRAAVVVTARGEQVIDTPGFDDPDEALLALAPLWAEADAVLWVTDGLQPWTATERSLHARLDDPRVPVVRVVSRADLVAPEEQEEVTDRLRALADLPVWWADLRARAREGGALPPALRFPHPGPRRRARIEALLGAVRAPAVPTPDAIVRDWHGLASAAHAAVVHRWESGGCPSRAALAEALLAAHESVLAELGPRVPVPLPALPTPRLPRPDRRSLRAAGADWVAAGTLALTESWPAADALRSLGARADALRRALDAARTAL